MMRQLRLGVVGLAALLLAQCSEGVVSDDQIGTAIAQTQELEVLRSVATRAAIATLTLTPTDRPPDTPVPTETFTPAPTATPGPIRVTDDFATDIGIWLDCTKCEWTDGGLVVGPFSDSVGAEPEYVVCGPCGTTSTYRMSVDVAHHGGLTGAGYGFVLHLDEDSRVDYRISPWQIAGLDHIERGISTVLVGEHSTLIKGGVATNRIEVSVIDSGIPGRSDIRLMVNGKTIRVYSGLSIGPTVVGLRVGGTNAVLFDNFEFEELEPKD